MTGGCHAFCDQIKVLAIGDAACGKTSLLKSLAGYRYEEDYQANNVFDFFNTVLTMKNERKLNVSLWDSSGSAEFDTFRPLAYPGTSIVLLCYDIGRPHTLDSIKNKWLPEINKSLPGVPYALVGCKRDVRTDKEFRNQLAIAKMIPVSTTTALDFAKEIDVVEYFECSSRLEDESIALMMQAVSFYALNARKGKASAESHAYECLNKGTSCQCRLF